MEEQQSAVKYKGVEYEVYLDEYGYAWFVDPSDPTKSKTNIGQVRGVSTIDGAKEAVISMLEGSGR